MKFRVIYQKTYRTPMQSDSGRRANPPAASVGWINRYLDREYVRRLANRRSAYYAHSLLHFVRWWESVHHTGEIPSPTLPNRRCWIMCASSPVNNLRLLPPPSTIASPVADRAIRNQFPDAPCQMAHGFHKIYLHRRPMGLGRPRSRT